MIHSARDLSPDQKILLERLLGRPIADNESISVRVAETPPTPEWLLRSWQTADELGVANLSSDEIDAEIAAARRERPEVAGGSAAE